MVTVILDAGVNDYRVRRYLEMRGFRVLMARVDVPHWDHMIVEIAERMDAVIVTTDRDFTRNPRAVVIPMDWAARRYNKRELATKIAKLAALAARRIPARGRGP